MWGIVTPRVVYSGGSFAKISGGDSNPKGSFELAAISGGDSKPHSNIGVGAKLRWAKPRTFFRTSYARATLELKTKRKLYKSKRECCEDSLR